jgi:hypothetical protein
MNSSSIQVADVNDTLMTEKHLANLPNAGKERLKADYRMYGCLLLLLGLTASYGSFADIVSLAGNPTVNSGLPLANLIAAVVQCFFGTVCMVVGYAAAIMDVGNSTMTSIAVGVIQMAWLPFTAGLSGLVLGAMSDAASNPFIPLEYNPTTTDVRFIGAMSFLAQIAYAIGFIGSLGFMAFSMHAIQTGKPEHRSGLYFRGRARTYNALFMLAGFTQLAIGSYILNKFGQGPLKQPISPGVYGVIFFPEISITVGVLQLFTGAIGFTRSLHKSSNEPARNMLFQVLCLFTYICMISMQDLSQVAYAPGGEAAALAPTLACVYFGLVFMPAFLDWKMNNVPENLEGYYHKEAGESANDNLDIIENGESSAQSTHHA